MAIKPLVLVTGGSGYIASYCVLQLLAEGYQVRATVRSLSREAEVRKALEHAGATHLDRLSFVAADLASDDGWTEAVANCQYVLHVASPLPPSLPKHEDELIGPARDGTLRILRAARDAGVQRVVVTSSISAIFEGHPYRKEAFTEGEWALTDKLAPYPKSKILAEQAAWDFIKNEGGSLELSVVCPGMAQGPIMSPDFSISVIVVERLLKGEFPGCPQLGFDVVDVRDLADLHIRCMVDPKANGERFIGVSEPYLTIQDMSKILKEKLGNQARKAPNMVVPNFVLRLVSYVDKEVGLITHMLGVYNSCSAAKAKELLGWKPRPAQEALVASAEALIKEGVVKV